MKFWVLASVFLILATVALAQDVISNDTVGQQVGPNSNTTLPSESPLVNPSANESTSTASPVSNITPSQSGTITLTVAPKPRPMTGWLITAGIIALGLVVYWLVSKTMS